MHSVLRLAPSRRTLSPLVKTTCSWRNYTQKVSPTSRSKTPLPQAQLPQAHLQPAQTLIKQLQPKSQQYKRQQVTEEDNSQEQLDQEQHKLTEEGVGTLVAESLHSSQRSQPTSKSPTRAKPATPSPSSSQDSHAEWVPSSTPVSARTTKPRPIATSERKARATESAVSNGGTFVSSHFKVDEKAIQEYLRAKGITFRVAGGEIVLKECNWCPDTKGKLDNFWKLNISREHGAYMCHRCNVRGSWYDFKSKIGNVPQSAPIEHEEKIVLPNQDHVNRYPSNLLLPAFAPLLEWLTSTASSSTRHISLETLQKYEVGATMHKFVADKGVEEHMCVTFPWISQDEDGNRGHVLRLKLRAMNRKGMQRLEPKGGGWGLFGWHTIPHDAREIVVTEGEFDAMAVHQATGMPAVSLPNGASSLPPKVLPLLERFERIYLWMDDDVPGQEGAKKFAQKLGSHRCYIVHAKETPDGAKDANDALRMGLDLTQMIQKAQRPKHDQIVTFDELRSELELELTNPAQSAGVQSNWLPSLTKILKGHRNGELTVLSGITGVGKTSILSQLSLDYCLQGVRTLWGSFELQLPTLAKKMLRQFSERDLSNPDEYSITADEFSTLPIYFLRFFGSTQVDQIVDAMEHAVYVHDVEHIILDNLQFMVSAQGKGTEKFEIMDEAVHKFRQFATNHNVHITLVIHPKKQTVEGEPLSIFDIFGNAKATQEADNVVILQAGPKNKYLEIKKNRYSGDLGKVQLTFNKKTLKFDEVVEPPPPPPQVKVPTTASKTTTIPKKVVVTPQKPVVPQKPPAPQKPVATQKPATPQKVVAPEKVAAPQQAEVPQPQVPSDKIEDVNITVPSPPPEIQ